MQRIKKDDTVQVMAGKDKGKRGTVLRVWPREDKVLVEGVNIVTRHQRPTMQNPQGGIEKVERPLHMSKVMPVDPKSDEPTRVGFEIRDGKKVRIAKKSGEAF
ncbi:50S ribosomal protein L24 [Stomatohabitans albus]|uniref:50S ribosomal protein L24 n=1 Tax=Stomatohabitans albus TaxID=3110766 RepID=UPI00300D1BC5